MQAHEAVTEGLLILSAVVLIILLCQPVRTEKPAKPPASTPAAAVLPQPACESRTKTDVQQKTAKRPVAAGPRADAHKRVIVVSLEDRRLALLEDGAVKATYPVAVGRNSSPSPTGTFRIVQRVSNPTYYHKGQVIPPGLGNPVGARWLGLSRAGYGIHGTNAQRSIGKAASHGCIRMARPDLESLFAQIRVGDTVEIVGTRDAQTVALFGEPATPGVSAAAATVLARSDAPAQPAGADGISAGVLTAAAVPAALPVGQ